MERKRPCAVYCVPFELFNTLPYGGTLAATALGLGTHWVGCTSLTQKELRDLLAIPDSVEIVATLTLGYPAEDSNVRGGAPVARERLPPAEIVYNRW